MNALARRLRQGRDQAGFTVLEVAVTTLILGIVLGIAYGFLVQTQSVESRSTNDAQLEKLAQIAERTLSEDVRGADPISAACGSTTDAASPALPTSYSSCVSFSVVRNTSGLVGCPKSAFVYALVGTNLVEDRTDYDSSCVAGASFTRRVLLSSVVNTPSQPLFTWYASDGSTIDVVNSPSAVAGASAVKVSVYATYQSNGPVLRFTNYAALRNNVRQ